MASLAPVNPDIIIWARKYHNLSQEGLAEKAGVHVNQIVKWEGAQTKPTFNQAKKLASVLNLPFGYLFLSDPPTLETPLPDLRRRTSKPLMISPNFRDMLYAAFDRFDWYKEYLEANDALVRLSFVGSATINDDPIQVAASIRQVLKLNPDTRRDAESWIRYLKTLTARTEDAGILVMRSSVVGKGTRRPLLVEEFQGFVITDQFAPIVFINSRDFVTAQIFTLTHELAHIWVGQSGILDTDESDLPEPHIHENVETFCNAVAAEVLVPAVEFPTLWTKHRGSTADLCREFWVSEIVVLRRAYELRLITSDEFFPRLRALKDAQTQRRGFGRSTYLDRIATQHSEVFTDAVIKDTRAGGTLFRDGAELLSMTVPTFMGVIEGRET
jgi:Zn-dependent peptidase ImmA (M78 family)/transcriptional regulator with XRE-family HTH domain